MLNLRYLREAIIVGGLTGLLLPIPNPFSGQVSILNPPLEAQARVRSSPPTPPPAVPSPASPQANAQAAPQAANGSPSTQPVQSPAAVPALPPSMLQQPAKPAHIEFSAGTLSIQADNSSLTEILRQLAKQSGMQIDGLGADERVFGSFGPGMPRDILSDLLNGTPYNILMVGDLSNGAPDKLILTPSSQTASAATPAQAAPQPVPEYDDVDTGDAQPQPFPSGQIPPRSTPGNPSDAAAPPPPKTPQQMFQELLAMRQKQQQQQEQQQQQQQQQ